MISKNSFDAWTSIDLNINGTFCDNIEFIAASIFVKLFSRLCKLNMHIADKPFNHLR